MTLLDSEKKFFGRDETLQLLKRRVHDLKEGYRQNVAFLGPSFVGKTSLLRKFLFDLDDNDIAKIYLDLEQKDFNYLFNNFAGSLLYHFARSKGFPLQDDLAALIETTKEHLPQTIDAIRHVQQVMKKKRFSEAYCLLMELPEIFTLESGKFCVITIDEFHNLDELDINDVFQELGKRIMTQKRCLYVVASSSYGKAKQILAEKLSLLFGHFEIVDLENFDHLTSRAFIHERLGSVKISPYLRDFLIDFTGGHPFYLDILVNEILHLSVLHQQEEVFVPILSQATENTIFNRWGVLSRHFEIMINQLIWNKNSRESISLLIALADRQHKIEDLVEATEFKKGFVTQRMARLIEMGVVEKTGNFYYLPDKLFKYWIKYILQKRLNTIEYDAAYQQNRFREEFRQSVEDSQIASEQELSMRLMDLLRCFDNESVSWHGKRYRLPLFHKIKPIRLENISKQNIDMIKASSQDGSWFIIFKEDPLTEKEVETFVNESKKLTRKLQRRVVISLRKLDDNVHLRALQERMWIWNEGQLSLLSNMYDKPFIVK